jgi:hypothetical protein
MAQAVRRQVWRRAHQRLPKRVAIEQLPEGITNLFELTGVNGGADGSRQLHQTALELTQSSSTIVTIGQIQCDR